MFTTPSPVPAGPARIPLASRLSAYWIALAILLADQGAKTLVHESTPYGWQQPVTGFFNLVHVWNYGAAFSFLADAGGWQRYFFGAIALLVSAWLIYMLRKPLAMLERRPQAAQLAPRGSRRDGHRRSALTRLVVEGRPLLGPLARIAAAGLARDR